MRTTIAALAATFVVATAGFALPQDPVPLSPQMYTVLLENQHVRVLEFRCNPGDKEPMHSHPAMVVYSLTASKLRSTTRDGETVERETKPGTAEWVEAMTHSGECLGPGEHRAILTELQGHGLATERDGDPMARFAPFVGEWNVRHTLWSSDGKEQVF